MPFSSVDSVHVKLIEVTFDVADKFSGLDGTFVSTEVLTDIELLKYSFPNKS